MIANPCIWRRGGDKYLCNNDERYIGQFVGDKQRCNTDERYIGKLVGYLPGNNERLIRENVDLT
jgi:hypothetical protein